MRRWVSPIPSWATDIAYNRGNWHWWYGFDVMTPGPCLSQGRPHQCRTTQLCYDALGRLHLSSASRQDGNQFPLAVLRQLHRSRHSLPIRQRVPLGVCGDAKHHQETRLGANGYFYQQTTADRLMGVIYEEGNQGRNLAIGPEVRYQTWPHGSDCQVFPRYSGGKPPDRK